MAIRAPDGANDEKCFQVDGVKIHGSPHVPGIGCEWAFFYKRDEAEKVHLLS